MREVREMKHQPLTAEAVLALHRAVTDGTLDDPAAAGRLQLPTEDRVEACDVGGHVLHRPPPAEQLPERLRAMVQFANAENGTRTTQGDHFLHPVIRAIMLHFWLAYDHPFADGNGRTARALFYWAMLRQGYWMFEFLSISRFLKAAHVQYAQAFLHAETDGNDATYFIVHQVDTILRSLDALDRYLQVKAAQAARIDRLLRNRTDLNHRPARTSRPRGSAPGLGVHDAVPHDQSRRGLRHRPRGSVPIGGIWVCSTGKSVDASSTSSTRRQISKWRIRSLRSGH